MTQTTRISCENKESLVSTIRSWELEVTAPVILETVFGEFHLVPRTELGPKHLNFYPKQHLNEAPKLSVRNTAEVVDDDEALSKAVDLIIDPWVQVTILDAQTVYYPQHHMAVDLDNSGLTVLWDYFSLRQPSGTKLTPLITLHPLGCVITNGSEGSTRLTFDDELELPQSFSVNGTVGVWLFPDDKIYEASDFTSETDQEPSIAGGEYELAKQMLEVLLNAAEDNFAIKDLIINAAADLTH